MTPMSDEAVIKQNKLRELRHEMIQVSNGLSRNIQIQVRSYVSNARAKYHFVWGHNSIYSV